MFTRVFTFLIVTSTLIFSGGFSPLGYAKTPDIKDLRSPSSKINKYCVHNFSPDWNYKDCNKDKAVTTTKIWDKYKKEYVYFEGLSLVMLVGE
jgi:hypothetical protein